MKGCTGPSSSEQGPAGPGGGGVLSGNGSIPLYAGARSGGFAVVILHRSCMLCAPATPSLPRCTAQLQFRSHIWGGGGGDWCVAAGNSHKGTD